MDKNPNLLYFYDLPKDLVTSIKIAQIIKEQGETENIEIPQIRRDPNKPFYTAIVKFNDAESFKKATEKLKYFEMDGRQCRALPFDKDLLGSNRIQTNKNNVFVKGINKDIKSKDLEEKLGQFGTVKSAKISINPDYSSRGYGFVCFQTPQDAENAIKNASKVKDIIQEILPYNPKDRREVRKLYNNIYVKNFPPQWTEKELGDYFGKYGEIKSLVLMKKVIEEGKEAPFAFICYEKANDKEYGPKCASRAVNELHDKEVAPGLKLYVREALKKAEREQEKRKDQMRFKNSKKRCNLYVKNFPPNTTEQQLREYFGKFGEIESVKIFSKDGEAVYAFVCFKNPDNAALAKNQLNQQTFNGKILYINHYEIKEVRKIQQEEIRDKADFQNYKKQSQVGAFSSDMINRPEIFALIQQLIMYMQRQHNQPYRQGGMGYNRGGPRQPRTQHAPGTMPPKPMHQGQMPPPAMIGQSMSAPSNMRMGMPPGQMPPQMTPMGLPPQANLMMPQGLPPFIQEYVQKGVMILPAVVPQNPNYKGQVGEFIYEYVEKIAGEEKAPKITGMLIDLPIEEIKGYVVDYTKLQQKIQEANQLLAQY